MFSVHTTLGEFENGAFTLNVHASNVFRPHYAEGNLKTELSL